MQDWVENLLTVQDKDLRIAKLEELIATAPEDRRKVTKLVDDAKAAVAAVKHQIQEESKALKSLEMEVESVRGKMRDFQAKSTMIKNNDEYKAALHQIETCAKQVAEREDRELLLMEEIEQTRSVLAERQKELAATGVRANDMIADLDTRLANSAKQIEKLRAERQAAEVNVSPDILKRYERIRANNERTKRVGKILVPINENSVCERCRMNVTAQVRVNVRKGECVACENCGALLYSEA